MLNSGTLSPNPGIYRFSARMLFYTEVTCTEDKAPQGCDPSADARAGMARGGLPAAPNSNPRLPRAIAYCRPKMVLTMGSTLVSGATWEETSDCGCGSLHPHHCLSPATTRRELS